ncbi:YciE/YciF ferroxidase family protein [Halegenticoccus soli]|uniref:YciE/YciF ferroxidase family protein n=1 Tax=Halegenticoccus soli TaxID=1985678 RepID=UPI001E5D9996|nr:DUF892 family protein [Halegenticoccus soli]
MNVESLHDMFVYQLQGMYYTENQLVDILDEMATETTDEDISRAFADHRDETRNQVERLDNVFAALNEQPQEQEMHVVDGLNRDRMTFKEVAQGDDLLNLHCLGAGMKNERLEITAYENLLMLANQLDLGDDVTDPLQQNADEEEDALDKLQGLSGGSGMKAMFQRLLG